MANLSELAQVAGLLDQLATVEEELSPNKRELFDSLKTKSDAPAAASITPRLQLPSA